MVISFPQSPKGFHGAMRVNKLVNISMCPPLEAYKQIMTYIFIFDIHKMQERGD